MTPLIANLIANIVIPEAIAFIKQYNRESKGNWPTAAEVMAGLPALADMYIDEGEAWLNRNKPADDATTSTTKPKKKKRKKKAQ